MKGYPRVFKESHGLILDSSASGFSSSAIRSAATLGAHRFKEGLVVCSEHKHPKLQQLWFLGFELATTAH